jgi:hypothetical protein
MPTEMQASPSESEGRLRWKEHGERATAERKQGKKGEEPEIFQQWMPRREGREQRRALKIHGTFPVRPSHLN